MAGELGANTDFGQGMQQNSDGSFSGGIDGTGMGGDGGGGGSSSGTGGTTTGGKSGGSGGMFASSLGVIGGAIGGLLNNDDEDKAKDAREKALQVLLDTATPDDLKDPIVLKQFQQAGLLTPQLMEKLQLNADKQTTLSENPQNRQNQQDTLNALKQMSQTGLTAGDRAAYNQLRSQTAADTTAKTNQILQQEQMRGQASGGNTLAAQLASVQGAGQNASAAADRLAQNATSARANALNQFGQMSGQVRNADLNTQEYNTNNELARQRFIDQNSLARQQTNVGNQNAANVTNLNRQQGVSDRNTAAANAELYSQKQREQQLYEDQMQRAKTLNAAYMGNSNYYNQSAANTAQNWANAGQGMGQSVDSYMGTGGSSGGGGGGGGSSMMSSMGGGGGGMAAAAHGGEIQGKAQVEGDSPKNDTVPIMASPGEIVIPRTFAHDPDLAKAYVNFIHKHKKNDPASMTKMANGGVVPGLDNTDIAAKNNFGPSEQIHPSKVQMVKADPNLKRNNNVGDHIINTLGQLHERIKRIEEKKIK